MTAPRLARMASRLLAREGQGPVPAPTPQQRADAISRVELALRARARRRRQARWVGTIGAAAAVVLVAVGTRYALGHRAPGGATTSTMPAPIPSPATEVVGRSVAGAASVVVAGAAAPLEAGRRLPSGSRVVTPQGGRVMLAFATGTSVVLQEAADMTIADEGETQALTLDRGSLELHVAKLSKTERFLVHTPDAEVEVRGTAFQVAVVSPDPSCGGGAATRVSVDEGVVVVRHDGQEARVEAGQRWPAGCASGKSAEASPSARAGASGAMSSRAGALGPAAPVSSLGEQNDLFADAVAAKRRGDGSAALAGFDRFLTRYPGSPLAESAAVERMRLLRSEDGARALSAAKRYLARYPSGFARAEAQAIVTGSSSP